MKRLVLMIAAVLVWGASMTASPTALNITPAPVSAILGSGEFTITPNMKIGTKGLTPEMKEVAQDFAQSINKVSGYNLTVANSGAITLAIDKKLPEEGYKLVATPKSLKIYASTRAGLFYGLMTVKKMLPAFVAAGVKPTEMKPLTIPAVTIEDAPRFSYRGYMLDVSRHFFTIPELKKILDLMAVYKLNRFQWHLTDDHGWRLPVPQYPKLTTVGATFPFNTKKSNHETQEQWRTSEPDGPYAYTEEEIADLVDYARKLNIEIIPEVEFPGHMAAALTAYPNLSTNPAGGKWPHYIWTEGGVSRDVLDVSNPEAIEFAQNVIDQVVKLFPFGQIHFGGDECPTTAWEQSPKCKAFMKEKGMSHPSELQTWFFKQIADYAKSKDRESVVWNETITEKGANLPLMQEINPTIISWFPADRGIEMADSLGLRCVYTPFGPYYVNRRYSCDSIGAGHGKDDLINVYNQPIPPAKTLEGVTGTFWTEQVDRPEDVEYLTFPRLIAIAERGWTPEEKVNYDDFIRRMALDTEIFELGNYKYGKHQIKKE